MCSCSERGIGSEGAGIVPDQSLRRQIPDTRSEWTDEERSDRRTSEIDQIEPDRRERGTSVRLAYRI